MLVTALSRALAVLSGAPTRGTLFRDALVTFAYNVPSLERGPYTGPSYLILCPGAGPMSNRAARLRSGAPDAALALRAEPALSLLGVAVRLAATPFAVSARLVSLALLAKPTVSLAAVVAGPPTAQPVVVAVFRLAGGPAG